MLPTEIVLHKKPFFENLVAENTFFGQEFSHVQNVKIILLSICQMVHGCVLYAVLESRKLCIATSAETKSLTQILLMFVKNFFLEVAQKKGRTK